MTPQCEAVIDELDELVAGNPDAIARHSEHLASCDDCRDARHEASELIGMVRDAGADHVPQLDLADRVLARLGTGAGATSPGMAVAKPELALGSLPGTPAPVTPATATTSTPATATTSTPAPM